MVSAGQNMLTEAPMATNTFGETATVSEDNGGLESLRLLMQYLMQPANKTGDLRQTQRSTGSGASTIWSFAKVFYPPEEFDYGCWCHHLLQGRPGRGPTLDEYDGFCRELFQCYRCVIFDTHSSENEDKCDPFSQEFSFQGSAFDTATATSNCVRYNADNPCAWRTCSCTFSVIT